MKKLILIAALCTTVYACSQKVMPSVKKSDAHDQDAVMDIMSKGRHVYQSRCGECHGLKNIADYSNQRWTEILREMMPKAKLSTQEKEQLIVFIQANAKG